MHFEFCWCIQLKIAFRRIWMLLQRILATAGIGQTDSFPTETWNFFCGRGVYSQFTHNALFTISPSNLLFANNSQAWYFTIRNAISLVTHRPRADGRNSWKIVERWPQMIISSICSCLIGQSIIGFGCIRSLSDSDSSFKSNSSFKFLELHSDDNGKRRLPGNWIEAELDFCKDTFSTSKSWFVQVDQPNN